MQNKAILSICVVAALVMVSMAAILLSGGDDSVDRSSASFENTRLRIYGNANGDDVIDDTDKSIVEWIIETNSDDDAENDVDWKKTYPLADANHDERLDQDDVDVIQKIIGKQDTRMYYFNKYGRVTYVNYPISDKIGAEYLILQILPAIKSYDMLKAIDDETPKKYSNIYPGISELPVMGSWREMTVENLSSLYDKGVIGTFMQWTGGQNTDYIWDKAKASGLADKMSFVIVPCQGPDVIQGVLEIACMLGDQTLSDDYREWYDEAMGLMDGIEGKIGSKKTITAVSCYSKSAESIKAFGSDQGPALWFNKVMDFQKDYVGKTNFTTIGSIENFSSSATDEVVVMFQKNCDWKDFNGLVEEYLTHVYGSTEQFGKGRMYAVDFELMPFAAGPAGCYILAAKLYPELFDIDDALDFLQKYLDDFAVRDGANAREGYTYTGAGYS